MADPAKPSTGGNLKYVIGGLLLLGGALGLWLMLQSSPAPAPVPAPAPAPAPSPERVNPMADQDLILDEPPDAGPAQPETVAEPDKPKKPRVAREEWDCAGDLQRAALQGVIDQNRSQIRNCYERRLKVNNVLQGDLKLKLKIGSNGHMAATSVTGTLKDNEVFACVRAIASKWTFPPPTGGDCAVVQVPFQFSPKSN